MSWDLSGMRGSEQEIVWKHYRQRLGQPKTESNLRAQNDRGLHTDCVHAVRDSWERSYIPPLYNSNSLYR